MALVNSYIDTTYFIGDINIPNVSSSDVLANLEALISKQQSIFLTDLFGVEFYALVATNTNFGNDPIDGTSSIYTDLIQGVEFVMGNGDRNRTIGLTGELVNVSGGYLASPIANYCYYQYMRQNESQTTGVGEVIQKAENSVRIYSNSRMSYAWNEMVDMLWVLHEFLIENESDYPSYIGHEYAPIFKPKNNVLLAPNQMLFVKQNMLGL